MADAVSTNLRKFQTRNPVVRRLIDRFYRRVGALVQREGAESLLDAGCGEGESLARLSAILPEKCEGFDVNPASVAIARERHPGIPLSEADIYKIPHADESFDVVMCLEVLEHLDDPSAAFDELARVARRTVLLSVPHEPWFRLGSLLRGNHISSLGNHPEHVNHWSPRSFFQFLSIRVRRVKVYTSFPWIIARCRK